MAHSSRQRGHLLSANEAEEGGEPSQLRLQAAPVLSLELAHGDSWWAFDFDSDEGRAVVVGSDPAADVCIWERGVARMHFHFEREGDRLLVVSGYGSDVRVDAVPVRSPRSLSDLSVVEFAGVRLGVRIRRIARRAHLFSSPSSAPPGASSSAPPGAPSSAPAEEAQGRAPVDRALFEARTGAIEVPPRFTDDAETTASPRRKQVPMADRSVERRATGSFDGDFKTEAMVMRFDWEPTEDAEPAAAPSPCTPRNDQRISKTSDWLEELGLLAKTRPIAVTAAVLVTATVTVFALVGARSVMDARAVREDCGTANRVAPSVTSHTTLSSGRPEPEQGDR